MEIFQSDYKDYISSMDEKDVVFLDPPWDYDNIMTRMHRNQLSYALWDTKDGLDFVFKNLKCKYIFMWVTNPFLQDIFLAEKYNFEYRTLYTWVKDSKNGKFMWGLGSYGRGCTEHIMVFKHNDVGSLGISVRNAHLSIPGKRTEKPREWECVILNELIKKGLTKFSYIFCGPKINSFINYNIDLVDIALDEKLWKEKLKKNNQLFF